MTIPKVIDSYYSLYELPVSKITLGTMTNNFQVNWKTKLPIYEKAIELGINSFDTAPNYCAGDSEKLLGKLLTNKSREKFIVNSKVFFEHPASNGYKGLSTNHIRETVENSLRNMQSDYLDVLFCHRFDINTPVKETIQIIGELLKEGKIKAYGVSAFSPMQLLDFYYEAQAQGVKTPKLGQYAYNLFNRDIEKELNEIFISKNIKNFTYYPLAQGVLTAKYTSEKDDFGRASDVIFKNYMWDFQPDKIKLAQQFKTFCLDHQVSPVTLAYNWCLRNEAVCSVITNVSSEKQLISNLLIQNEINYTELFQELNSIFKNEAINQYTNQKYKINERKISH